MHEITIAAIALSDRDYASFDEKLSEAVRWIELAAKQGAELAVLPEALNKYRRADPHTNAPLETKDVAFADWASATAPLFDVATRCGIAVTAPVLTREGDDLTNSFFFIDEHGEVIGSYQKMRPMPPEAAGGIVAGEPGPFEWRGLRIGGAICFDCYYPEVFQRQAALGVDLFLMPSLTPAGQYLNFYALHHAAPVVLAYPHWSRIIDVDGRERAGAGYRNETLRFGFGTPIAMATLNFDRVVLYADLNQNKIRDILDAYGDRVRAHFDQPNVIFTLESRSPDLSIQQVVREYKLVTKTEYFANPEKAWA